MGPIQIQIWCQSWACGHLQKSEITPRPATSHLGLETPKISSKDKAAQAGIRGLPPKVSSKVLELRTVDCFLMSAQLRAQVKAICWAKNLPWAICELGGAGS